VTDTARRYEFNWGLLGDIEAGRPSLGPMMRIEVYRLMQFSLRDAIERRCGTQDTDLIFYEAGRLAGIEFYRNVLGPSKKFETFVGELQRVMREMGIGVLAIEKADLAAGQLTLTVSEDLDCSGLPKLDSAICVFDEGFIAALLESFSGRRFRVDEIDCWSTGARTCRFQAQAIEG